MKKTVSLIALAELGGGPVSNAALAQELARLLPLRAGQAILAEAVAGGGIQQIDVTGDIAGAACPVSVLFGTGDRILDWREVAALPPEAAVHLLRDAGHLPHLSSPDLVVRLIAGGRLCPQQPETSPGTVSGQDADAHPTKVEA